MVNAIDIIGQASATVLGFIMYNIPGAVAGFSSYYPLKAAGQAVSAGADSAYKAVDRYVTHARSSRIKRRIKR
jgi:hypothetical protein